MSNSLILKYRNTKIFGDVHHVLAGGWRLAAGGWRLVAGGW
jgi:hypothetical protein